MNSRELGMENFKTTGIYALTAEHLSRGRSNADVVDEMLRAGIRFLQYREKTKNAKTMYEECRALREAARAAGAAFIVNDRVDLAMAVDADGVHIGQEDLPPEAARKLIGNRKILGLSTHNPKQIRLAELSGAVDYIGVGPVFETKTKTDVCAAVGLAYVRYAARHSRLPFVAIGGIKESNIREVAEAGAKTIAIVSDIVGAEDIAARISSLRRLMLADG